jgi:NADH-quinone oxidoreductase subunit G
MKALLLFNVEPELDAANGAAAKAALQGSGLVVAFTPFRDAKVENADVLLPIAPFTETAGAFINAEARLQAFQGVVKPRGQTRPGWKVLRVLGNLLAVTGFDQESAEQVRAQALPEDVAARLSNAVSGGLALPAPSAGLQRVADVPLYAGDVIVRRAPSLQATRDAQPPKARMNAATLATLGLAAGDAVRVRQALGGAGQGEALLEAALDPGVADGTVRIATAHASTAGLGGMFGEVAVERAR